MSDWPDHLPKPSELIPITRGGGARDSRADEPRGADYASEDDRLWFEDHPDETIRKRDAFPGELPPIDYPPPLGMVYRQRVTVTQVKPGLRVRQAQVYLETALGESGTEL